MAFFIRRRAMLGELVLVDFEKCTRIGGVELIINIPKAERESGVHIVGVFENGAGGLTAHAETSDPICLEKVRVVCQSQVIRDVRVKPDPVWEKDNEEAVHG
jgi:hypothetical protein